MRPFCLPVLLALATSCYHLPKWKGDVTVTALERPGVSTCGPGTLTAEGAQRVTRPPYLQSTTATNTTVVWGSIDGRGAVLVREPDSSQVHTATAVYAGDPRREASRRAKQKRAGELAADDIYLVKAQLANLAPGKTYCYQLVVDGIPLTQPAPLQTAAAPGGAEPVRFVALGDSGNGSAAQLAIAKRMSAARFDFMVFLGDIAYTAGTAAQLDSNFFGVYRDFIRYVPFYPAIGNHERRTRQGAPYFDAFVLPGTERYYSFDWGDVHLVAIDTTHYDAAQLRWLAADLGANKLPWVIVFGHHPPYTSSLRGPQRAVRRAFAKIFTDHAVDLVVTGHEHQYERLRVANVNYVVSGGGGGQLNDFRDRGRSLRQAAVHHFLSFAVTKQALEMTAIDIEGRVIETLKLSKPTPSAAPKVKVDGKPEVESTPIAPEQKTEPDEQLHDEPDDDSAKPKLPPEPRTPQTTMR